MTIYGIIGGAGSGKSTLLAYLKKRGFGVFNSDEKVKELSHDAGVAGRVREELGLDGGGELKKQLIEKIKKDASAIKEIEKIIHPLIERQIVEFLAENREKTVFLEIPLLYEAGFDKYCDKVLLVERGDKSRQEALQAREDLELANILDGRQENVVIKRRKVDFIIENTAEKEQLYLAIEKLLAS